MQLFLGIVAELETILPYAPILIDDCQVKLRSIVRAAIPSAISGTISNVSNDENEVINPVNATQRIGEK